MYSHFNNAYTYVDQLVLTKSLVANSNLSEMNEIMCDLIANKLGMSNKEKVKEVSRAITETQSFYLNRNRSILEVLQSQYKLGIVSNFSGNLSRILNDFSLFSCFSFVLDSYHVGVSKPNSQIFQIALKHCERDPSEIFFIGDNLERDIMPAKNLGMNTILLSENLTKSEADYTLASLEELIPLTQRI